MSDEESSQDSLEEQNSNTTQDDKINDDVTDTDTDTDAIPSIIIDEHLKELVNSFLEHSEEVLDVPDIENKIKIGEIEPHDNHKTLMAIHFVDHEFLRDVEFSNNLEYCCMHTDGFVTIPSFAFPFFECIRKYLAKDIAYWKVIDQETGKIEIYC